MFDDAAKKSFKLERFEYYWRDGRVVEYVNRRKTTRARFPKVRYPKSELIASVRRVNHRNEVETGPQNTPDRLAEALLRYSRYFCDPETPDIGTEIPPELLRQVVEHAKNATDRVTRQWESVGNEEGQSGLFAGTINDVDKFQYGEWEATVRVQVFSPQIKEPLVGADLGIIVDLRNGPQQVVKAALIQAKRTEGKPASTMNLPDFAEQIGKMRETTDESYGLIYSDDITYLVHSDQPDKPISVERFFSETLLCRLGDRSHRTVAQAYDRAAVIDVTVATGGRR